MMRWGRLNPGCSNSDRLVTVRHPRAAITGGVIPLIASIWAC